MSEGEIPEKVRHFIFEQIDSAEQLDVLLFLRQNPEKAWNSHEVSMELRSTPISVASRLESLERLQLLEKIDQSYRYNPVSEDLKDTVNQLNEIYKIRRQKVFELIFSPMKKARHFADAFMVNKPIKKGE